MPRWGRQGQVVVVFPEAAEAFLGAVEAFLEAVVVCPVQAPIRRRGLLAFPLYLVAP
jgi:hypothetical protein